mgnify:CR=1 FL=1
MHFDAPEQKFVPIKKFNFLRNHKKLIFQEKLEFLKKLIFREIYENLDSPSRKKLIKIKKIKNINKNINVYCLPGTPIPYKI